MPSTRLASSAARFFWSLELMRDNWKAGTLAFAISFALLSISHNITALYCVVFVGLYVLLTCSSFSYPYKVALGAVLGVGLSAFYWLPALALKSSVHASSPWTMGSLPDRVLDHAIFWKQHLVDRWGKGPSISGPNDEFGITVGAVVLLGALLSIFALLQRGLNLWQRLRIIVLLVLFGFSLYIISPQMRWDKVPEMFLFVQFPWRLLIFSTFFGIAAFACAAPVLNRWMSPMGICVAAMAFSLPEMNWNMSIEPWWAHAKIQSDEELGQFFDYSEKLRFYVGSVAQEYLPNWVKPEYLEPSFHAAHPAPSNRLTLLEGEFLVTHYNHTGTSYDYDYVSGTDSIVRIHVFDFPGWVVRVNGIKSPEMMDRDENGLVRLHLPKGDHPQHVQLAYEISPIGRISVWISGGTFLLWCLLGLGFVISERKPRRVIVIDPKQVLLMPRPILIEQPVPAQSSSSPS